MKRMMLVGTAFAAVLLAGLPAAAYANTIQYGFSVSGSQGYYKRVPGNATNDQTLPSTKYGRTNVVYNCAPNDFPAVNYRLRQNIPWSPDKTIVTRTQVYGCQYNYASKLVWPRGKYYFEMNNYFFGQSDVHGVIYASN